MNIEIRDTTPLTAVIKEGIYNVHSWDDVFQRASEKFNQKETSLDDFFKYLENEYEFPILKPKNMVSGFDGKIMGSKISF